jgi:hypothetical protein
MDETAFYVFQKPQKVLAFKSKPEIFAECRLSWFYRLLPTG